MTNENERNNGIEKIKNTDHYKAQYGEGFVEKWDALIDWDARAEGEGAFFIRLLQEQGKSKILDLATGTGYHSITLMNAGFEVHSVDGSAKMPHKASENARKRGLVLRTIETDWRWLTRDIGERYDAVICLGNSYGDFKRHYDIKQTDFLIHVAKKG